MPPSGYMFSPGAYQTSATTPTFMEDLEDPNPLIDPETVNREFYQLDKVRETIHNLIASIGCPNRNTHHDCAYTFTYSCRCYLHNLMMLDGVILSLNQRSCDRPCIHQPMAHPPHNVASLALPTLINRCTIELWTIASFFIVIILCTTALAVEIMSVVPCQVLWYKSADEALITNTDSLYR